MHPRCRVIRPLSEEQVATLLDGKPVLGSLREIQEARNAIKAYDRYESWAPGSERDLLCAHDVLMAGLLDHPGRYRRGGVAVGGAGVVHHVAPPAGRVPELMAAALPDERVQEVLDDLGLGSWWRALPHGIHTELAGQNAELSAGQAQLLAFGRAFLLSAPGVVVLDEASSRLDPGTERSIERAVDRLIAGRTAIIIAHRLATVMRADWIALLDGGRLAEFGRRTHLLADPASGLSQLLRHGSEEVLQ